MISLLLFAFVVFADSSDCINKSNGFRCQTLPSTKICQDNICICERYDYFFCKSCGLPQFYGFKQHDDSITSIVFNFSVTFEKLVYRGFGLNNEFESKLLKNDSVILMNNKINNIDM